MQVLLAVVFMTLGKSLELLHSQLSFVNSGVTVQARQRFPAHSHEINTYSLQHRVGHTVYMHLVHVSPVSWLSR